MSTFLRLPGGSAPIADAARLGTLLGIWAHPDDEAFLSAGLMAAARDAGHRVVCVTATLGERGTDDQPPDVEPEALEDRHDRFPGDAPAE